MCAPQQRTMAPHAQPYAGTTALRRGTHRLMRDVRTEKEPLAIDAIWLFCKPLRAAPTWVTTNRHGAATRDFKLNHSSPEPCCAGCDTRVGGQRSAPMHAQARAQAMCASGGHDKHAVDTTNTRAPPLHCNSAWSPMHGGVEMYKWGTHDVSRHSMQAQVGWEQAMRALQQRTVAPHAQRRNHTPPQPRAAMARTG